MSLACTRMPRRDIAPTKIAAKWLGDLYYFSEQRLAREDRVQRDGRRVEKVKTAEAQRAAENGGWPPGFSRQTEGAIRAGGRLENVRSEVADNWDRKAVAHQAASFRRSPPGKLAIVGQAHQPRGLPGDRHPRSHRVAIHDEDRLPTRPARRDSETAGDIVKTDFGALGRARTRPRLRRPGASACRGRPPSSGRGRSTRAWRPRPWRGGRRHHRNQPLRLDLVVRMDAGRVVLDQVRKRNITRRRNRQTPTDRRGNSEGTWRRRAATCGMA